MRERNTTTELTSREFADKIAWNVDAPDFSNTPADSRRPEFDYVPADADAEPFVSIVTALFEAMSSDVLVVGADVGGQRELGAWSN